MRASLPAGKGVCCQLCETAPVEYLLHYTALAGTGPTEQIAKPLLVHEWDTMRKRKKKKSKRGDRPS